MWDAVTGKEVRSFAAHHKPVTRVTFHPGGARLASASREEGTVIVWELTGPRTVLDEVWSKDVRAAEVVFSPGGGLVAANDEDRGRVFVWDRVTGEECWSAAARGAAPSPPTANSSPS